jgi:glycerophosphoryl diester phosphodiesterase
VLDLSRRGGRPLVVGHRGAAALAPENTLEAFRAALELGVDVIELDVLALERGPLVVAHSDTLEELTHGRAEGRVGARSLAELRELAPALPTFDEALAWFAEEAPQTGIHVDLKLRARLDEVAKALETYDVADRAVVSSVHPDALRAVARASSRVRVGLTYPEDRLNVSHRRYMWPVVRAGLAILRASIPPRLPGMLRRAGAGALMLQHRLVSTAAVERAHAVGVPVLAWTVDHPADVERVAAAGVDGVITNDPRILLATLAP